MADLRTYIRVHDGMPDHPKVDGLSDAAFRLLVTTWCWCSRHLTDGRVPAATWKKRGTPKARRELAAAGLVEEVDGAVQMHDYLEHQRSAEEVREIREARGKGGALGNHVRWHVRRGVTDPECELCAGHSSDPGDVANGSHDRSQDRSGERHANRSQNGNGDPHQRSLTRENSSESEQGSTASANAPTSDNAQNAVAKPSQDRSQTDRKTSPETTTETEVPVVDVGDSSPPPPTNAHTRQAEEGNSATNEQALRALVADVKAIRPEWSERSIRRALTQPAVAERPTDVVRSAALAVARDPASHAPGRLEHDGPWWRLQTTPPPPPAPPAPEPWENTPPLGQRDYGDTIRRGRAAVEAAMAEARTARAGEA